jgi:transcriptional regulator with XRE-family HTH domain
MNAGHLIREARKRTGLSQRELAERLGTTQAAIARWERGYSTPSFDRAIEVIRACGLDLSMRLVTRDDQHEQLIDERLRMSPAERLERLTISRKAIEEMVASARPVRS